MRTILVGAFLAVTLAGCASEKGTQAVVDAGIPAVTGGQSATEVTEITGQVMVPADFQGEAAKIIFGWGDKPIVDEAGKLVNVPEQFLPSITGIPDPKVTAGKPYELKLTGISVPHGEHYVLVALYVKGTPGTIPQKDKDYVAGSMVKLTFAGAKMTMPAMDLKRSGGAGG